MEGVTLTIAAAASALVLFVSPIYGLILYAAVLVWYPSYLSVQVGTIDFTVRRILIMAVFAKLYMSTDLPRRFKFIWLDKIVILYFVAQFVAGLTTSHSISAFIENRAGRIFDVVLPYFAVRMIVTDKEKYQTFLKAMLIVPIPLAIIGIYQCFSGNNPFSFLMDYASWGMTQGYVPISRLGLTRANVVFAHPITYGVFFALIGPVCAGLLGREDKDEIFYWMGTGFMCIGLFASVSSGPAFEALIAIAFLVFYRYRKYWKPVIITIVISCVVVEILSDRHFYDVIDRFTLNSQTAWYRSRLIDVGLFEGGMSGHWITGYGYNTDPMWCNQIDGRDHTDMVNQYLLVLVQYGIVGLIPFLAINIAAVKVLVAGFKLCRNHSERWLIWCLAAGLFGLAGAFMTVSLFDQPLTLYYMLLGFSGSMPMIMKSQRPNLIVLRNIDGNFVNIAK